MAKAVAAPPRAVSSMVESVAAPQVAPASLVAAAGELLDVLRAQAALVDEHAALATERRRALATADTARLIGLLTRQEALATRLEQSDATRRQLLDAVAVALDDAGPAPGTVSPKPRRLGCGTGASLQRDPVDALASHLGQPRQARSESGATPTSSAALCLSDLCDAASAAAPETVASLREVQARLRTRAEEVIAAGREDARLLEALLDSATRSLHHLVRAVETAAAAPDYTAGGRYRSQPGYARLADHRA